jgi:adenosylmethionine-8-amino-7-oxononanoate aminotransferase
VHDLVSDVPGDVGTIAVVELAAGVRRRDQRAVFSVMKGARGAGSLVRPGGTPVGGSPPLTAGADHFELVAQPIEQG